MKGRPVWQIILGCYFAMLGGVLIGLGWYKQIAENAAIKAGVAHYVCDETTGSVEFRFIIPEKGG